MACAGKRGVWAGHHPLPAFVGAVLYPISTPGLLLVLVLGWMVIIDGVTVAQSLAKGGTRRQGVWV